ncbi:N(G),N(G)-dimethylarginine dimethylaminohydrolase [Nakamurella sp. YIM 132087]|uniref:N(G),N(G)-dimethylarginine dimethylaminohydrolase n=1 Tax=Nakamurella alba TaxID=2665158 RepID=A0A7K1FJ65_9ACTN|nr:dimethylargininase [Nakamurella alba]MTD13303.1 N(G),N(G)-dimethylarginine dimethylaminohydrolase [Nakamurella alba]
MSSAPSALVRRPSPHLADGLITHITRTPVDTAAALVQWQGYVDALTGAGWSTVEVAAAPEFADSAFVEDTVVMVGEVAVLTRPGAPERAGEPDATADTLAALGHPVRRMASGRLDGGDVLKVGDVVYVGRGGRTDAAGVAEFRRLVEPLGRRVVAVPISKVLHLKSAVTALPDGTIVGYPPLVDDPAFFPHFRPVPEEAGAHVVDLGGGRLLVAASAPRSAELLADLGYTPVPVDIQEFEKLEGCVTCLSVRLRVPPAGVAEAGTVPATQDRTTQ